MPCRPEEESAQGPEPEHPVKESRNHGASHADPDEADPDCRSDEEEVLDAKKTRPPRHVLVYEVVKRWVTGDRAVQDIKVINVELDEIMREHMELSGQKKFYDHKARDTDLGGWKFARTHTNKRGVKYDVYRCPLRGRTGCQVSMRVVVGPDFVELQRCGLNDKNSHDNDQSKKLTY